MKVWNKSEKESANIILGLNYKPRGMKDVYTESLAIKITKLSTREFNSLMKIIEKHSYKSRKSVITKNETNKQHEKNVRS